MSEDLRYNFFDHEADEQPSISSEEGWKSMQQLLDKEMPVSSKRRRKYLFFIVASLAGIIFLATSIPIKNYFEQNINAATGKKDIPNKKVNEVALNNFTKEENRSALNTPLAVLHENINSNTSSVNDQFNLGKSNNNKPESVAENIISELAIRENALPKNNNSLNKAVNTTDQSEVIDTAHFVFKVNKKTTDAESNSTNTNKKQSNNNFEPSWQLNACIATNISLSNTSHTIRPYPF